MQRLCRKAHNINQTACTDAYRVRPFFVCALVARMGRPPLGPRTGRAPLAPDAFLKMIM